MHAWGIVVKCHNPIRMKSDDWWDVPLDAPPDNRGRKHGAKVKSRRKPGGGNSTIGLTIPEGTEEEMTQAYNETLHYQAVLIDYADKEEIPQEVLDHQRRIFHFARHGPRKGFFYQYSKSKLVQADVLYILTAKVPAKILAKKFKVDYTLILDIRKGKKREWIQEYNMIRRLRTAIACKYKKNWSEKHVTLIIDSQSNEVIALLSSKRKARDYRRTWMVHNLGYDKEKVEELEGSGELDLMYPIIERIMTE